MPCDSALLRSVDGEALEEYSKRAYAVYRTHGVIQNGMLDDDWPFEARRLTLSTDPHDLGPATCSPIFRPAENAPLSETPENTSNVRFLADRGDKRGDVSVGGDAVCSVIHEPIRPFSTPRSLQIVRPNAGEGSGGNTASMRREMRGAEQASTIENKLQVVEVSQKEEVTQKPDESASPPRAFRSRLHAPRAGRAAALASANARGNGKRWKERPPEFCRELSGTLLPPPPPSAASGASTKPVWVNQRTPEASGKLELGYPVTDEGSGDANTYEDTTASQGNESPRACRDSFRDACSLPRDTGHIVEGEGVMEVVTCSSQELLSANNGADTADCNKSYRGKRCGISGVGDGCSEQVTAHEQNNDARANRESSDTPSGRRIKQSAVAAASLAKTTQLPDSIPRRKPGRLLAVDDHSEQSSSPRAAGMEEASGGSEDNMEILAARSVYLDTDPVGMHGDNTYTVNGVEPATENRCNCLPQEARCSTERPNDDEAFVWFGQPDTSSVQLSSEHGELGRRSREELSGQDDRTTSPVGQLHSAAKVILRMEVRRQRTLIERAFLAREEQRRARRAHLGAEVLKRIRSTPGSSLSISSGDHETHARYSKPLEPSSDRVGKSNSSQGLECQAYGDSPRHPKHAVKVTGLRARVDRGGPTTTDCRPERTTTVEPLPEYPLDTGPAASPVPTPPKGGVAGVAGDHPWRKLNRSTEAENVVTVRTATPPPISFDVTADGLRGGEGGFGRGGDLERARRQERYEALRARKLAEAEVSDVEQETLAQFLAMQGFRDELGAAQHAVRQTGGFARRGKRSHRTDIGPHTSDYDNY